MKVGTGHRPTVAHATGSERTPGLPAGGRMGLLLFGVALALLAVTSQALAATGYVPGGRISTLATTPPGFSSPTGIAVQQSTQDVFVVDSGNGRIVRLDSAGVFETSFTAGAAPGALTATFTAIASDDSSDDVYVVDTANAVVDRFDADGNYVSQIAASAVPGGSWSPTAVAVDPTNGNVYVADNAAPAAVEVFDGTGAFLSRIDGAGSSGALSTATGVAVDPAGSVYIIDSGYVSRFALDGTFVDFVAPNASAQAVTVDVSTGDMFAAVNPGTASVLHFNSAGTPQPTFGAGSIGNSFGLAINETSKRVWVADQAGNDIPYFDLGIAPDVTTGTATPTTDGAELTGTVDPLGEQTTYHFEYGPDESYGSSTPDVDAGSGSGNVNAAATVAGLPANSTFHYRLVASNDQLSTNGADATFTTLPIPPVVDTLAATDVRRNAATFNATIDPNNSSTTYHFEYGLTDSYGSVTADAVVDPGDVAVPVSTGVGGLEPVTEYHFRVVADNGAGGPQAGPDQTFTTLPPLAAVTADPITGVTQTSAVLHATIDNHGFASSYQFSLGGTDNAYQASTLPVDLPAVDGPQQVSAAVGGLPVDGSFQVRVFATTEGGTSFSSFATFKTLGSTYVPPSPPVIDLNPYGCAAPHLNAYPKKPKAGSAITLTGSDLGLGGVVTFGSTEADVDSWSATAIRVTVPSGAKGKPQVKVNCLRDSNVIAVAIAKKKAPAKKCKRGFVKKKVHGKTKCVKKKSGGKR